MDVSREPSAVVSAAGMTPTMQQQIQTLKNITLRSSAVILQEAALEAAAGLVTDIADGQTPALIEYADTEPAAGRIKVRTHRTTLQILGDAGVEIGRHGVQVGRPRLFGAMFAWWVDTAGIDRITGLLGAVRPSAGLRTVPGVQQVKPLDLVPTAAAALWLAGRTSPPGARLPVKDAARLVPERLAWVRTADGATRPMGATEALEVLTDRKLAEITGDTWIPTAPANRGANR